MRTSLDIIIVNWNSGEQLRRCLESIARAGKDGVEPQRVVVVDNASSDGSADAIDESGQPLTIIRNSQNRGFASACNEGASGSHADLLLFLNPDTSLASDCLAAAAEFMRSPENVRIGICGVQLADDRGRVHRSCSRFPRVPHFYLQMFGLARLFPHLFHGNLMSDWDHGQNRQVNAVTGAFFLVRQPVFAALEGFDERFFVYLEDVDFAYRAHLAGWNSFYLAEAHAFHRGGGCSRQVLGERFYYSLRSRILYGYKHFGWAPATLLLIATLLIEPLSRFALAASHGSFMEFRSTCEGYAKLWRSLPSLWNVAGKTSSPTICPVDFSPGPEVAPNLDIHSYENE